MVFIERDGSVVLGGNEHCKRCGLSPEASRCCVGEKCASESLALEFQIDCESTNADGGQRRIAREFFYHDLRQIRD